MAVPRHRTSNQRKRMRRSHHAKKPKTVAACTNCGSPRLPHVICSACGHYNNRPVLRKAETE
ncbi:MAG: 50S ribosomal protein L32 [Chlamydiales bacterium]|nr:50S ribosomal protein L32 [Chlamydiales bacterium]